MMLQVLLNGLAAAGPIALVAMGISLVFAVERLFHLAHAAVFTIAAYVAFALQNWCGLPCAIALPLAVCAATVMGLGVELAVYAPMRRRGASPLAILVASLGLVVVTQGLVSLVFGSQTLSLRSGEYSLGHRVAGARLTDTQIVSIVLSFVTCAAVTTSVTLTRAGLLFRAVASDPELAQIVGIPRRYVTLGAFLVASSTAALASLTVAYDTDLTPVMGFDILLLAFTAAVAGGLGSIGGAMLGGVLIGLTQHLAGWFLPVQWQQSIVFVVLVVFLLLRPRGFMGQPRQRAVT